MCVRSFFPLQLLVLGLFVLHANADFFLHNPRGSNNRYRGDTNNQARLFDSQNNNNGGYGWGPTMTYYEGSILHVEYTATHGCGAASGIDCEIVLQYMCGDEVRDGTRDDIPPNNIDALPSLEQQDYGYHEPVGYFRDCNNRRRNGGLFTADQVIGDSAVNTRQNDGGTRRGFECDEERDYYPYWHPSPWKDIAVLTSNPARCSYYQSQSQNVLGRGHCVTSAHPGGNYQWGFDAAENNAMSCTLAGNQWRVEPAWGIPAPDCLAAPNLWDDIDNYEVQSYKWVIPSGMTSGNCVLRARYNISSSDFNGWAHVDAVGAQMVDSSFNRTLISGNPVISYGTNSDLRLAVDTSQFGRTFQDRSHTFRVSPRPSNILSGRIWNMNVRGRRGNAVQAYPATQYAFSPATLSIGLGDYIHFQWTGSVTQFSGQAGTGQEGTDKSNILQISSSGRYKPVPFEEQTLFPNVSVAFIFAHLGTPQQLPTCVNPCDSGCCRTLAQMQSVAMGLCADGGINIDNQVQNCDILNFQSEYFNFPPIQYTKRDAYHFMSFRGSGFSRRSARGMILVDIAPPVSPPASLSPTSSGTLSIGVSLNLLATAMALVGFLWNM